MALDLFAAQHQKQIDKNTSHYGMSETLHDQLMNAMLGSFNFRLLPRLSDYYADATILLGELPSFTKELIEINSILEWDSIQKKASKRPSPLHELIQFCEEAYHNECNLYAYAD